MHLRVGVPLTVAVNHLLVREHRLALRTPVHRRLLPNGETSLIELEEDPLRPAIVSRIDGREFVVPIQHEPDPFELLAKPHDVRRNQLRRMGVDAERVVLRVNAERVEPDRLKHIPPLKPAEASVDVTPDEREHVPYVQPLR